MGEIKSVKVDNWGVFFLQKLQNFFNKTDYCDLTLQFNDNSQLKVHRLVLSACTDYFNVLESTCEMIDDVLVMPKDLQADVVVPIVNFMYTGTLEFEYKMYDRLLRTAREMNMTVLLKLLEAHRKTIPPKNLPVLLNKQSGVRNTNVRTFPSYQPVERHVPQKIERTYTSPAQRKYTSPQKVLIKTTTTSYIPKTNIPETVAIVSKYRHLDNKTGPSRFDSCNEEVIPDSFESFNPISYESKPLITAEQIKEEYEYERPSSSFEPFEQLRKGYTNPNKRTAVAARLSDGPSSKKLNLQDVKEYTEAHRLRKQLEAEECEDDGMDYEQQDDSFEEEITSDITIKQENVKETSGSVHHAKIISEVLKKYPHLVKSNKNLKLKISPKSSPEAKLPEPKIQNVVQKKKPTIVAKPIEKPRVRTIDSKTMHLLIAKGAMNTTGPWLCLRCGVSGRPISIPSYKSFRRHLINVHHEKVDSRLCEYCGFKSAKRIEQIYHLFIEHKVKPPGELVFPKCSECDYFAIDKPSLATHLKEEHAIIVKREIQHCIYCNKVFAKEIALYAHMRSSHKERAREDGVMDFSDEEQSFDEADKYIPNHMETTDNKIKILSNISLPTKGMSYVVDAQNVSQIGGKTIVNLEPSSEAEAFSNVASGIATSLGLVVDDSQYHTESHILPTEYIEEAIAEVHGEFVKKQQQESSSSSNDQMVTKVITGDGKELQLTAQQKEEIFSQLQDQSSDMTNNVVMVLNNDSFEEDHSQIISSDPNILVVYSQANEITKSTFIDSSSSIVESTEKIEDSEIVNAIKEVEMSTKDITTKDDSIDFEGKLDELLEGNIESKEQEEVKEDEAEEEEITEESSDKKNDADKLISALEGDWSEDEEETDLKKDDKEVEKVTEKEEEEAKEEEVKEEENKEVEESKEIETKIEEMEETVPDKDEDKKELPNIMEDWIESESQKSFTDELTSTKETDESTSSNTKVQDKKIDSTELKTLINDWGDDDDDL